MALIKKIADDMLYKGGIIGAGILGVVLWKKHRLPEYLGKVFVVITSLSICNTIWHILKGKNEKQESARTSPKEVVGKMNQGVISQLENRLSRKKAGGGAKKQEGVKLNNGNELPNQIANRKEIAEENRKLSVLFHGQNVSQRGSFLKTCADIYGENKALKSESQGYADAGDISDVSIVEDEIDEATMRELVTKQHEALENACKSNRSGGSETADVGEGVVFQASQLFKDWDTRRPDIEKELDAVLRSGKGGKLKKTQKGGRSKTSPAAKKN